MFVYENKDNVIISLNTGNRCKRRLRSCGCRETAINQAWWWCKVQWKLLTECLSCECLILKLETSCVSGLLQTRFVTASKRDFRASSSTSEPNTWILCWHSLIMINNLVMFTLCVLWAFTLHIVKNSVCSLKDLLLQLNTAMLLLSSNFLWL